MKGQLKMLRDLWKHMQRKPTVWVHILYGFFCGILWYWYPALAALMFVAFGVMEWWECRATQDGGHDDFWDGVAGLFTGALVLWLLTLRGVL